MRTLLSKILANLFIWLILFTGSQNLYAQDLPPAITKILQEVMPENGYLTVSNHEKFWDEVNNLVSDEEIAMATELVRASVLLAQEYQVAVWSSALESSRRYKVIRSSYLEHIEDTYPKALTAVWKKNMSIEEWESAVGVFAMNWIRVRKNTNKILEAAAKNQPFVSEQGVSYPSLSRGTVKEILISIRASFERISKLLDPDWPGSDATFLVGYGMEDNDEWNIPSVTMILSESKKEALVNQKLYKVNEKEFEFVLSRGYEKNLILDRTSLKLKKESEYADLNGFFNVSYDEMEIVDRVEYESVIEELKAKDLAESEARVREEAEKIRKHKEKLDQRKL